MTSWEREEKYKRNRAQTPADMQQQQQHIKKHSCNCADNSVSAHSSIHLRSAMSTHTNILLFITLWASMQDGLTKELKVEAINGVPTQRIRTKRCACSSLLDSECHYFCHLDIIWINTPSKTTLYGLGSLLSRRRRSTGRCTCTKPDDQSCTSFCLHSPDIKSQKKYQPNILSILRVLAKRPVNAQGVLDPRRDKFSEAQWKNSR